MQHRQMQWSLSRTQAAGLAVYAALAPMSWPLINANNAISEAGWLMVFVTLPFHLLAALLTVLVFGTRMEQTLSHQLGIGIYYFAAVFLQCYLAFVSLRRKTTGPMLGVVSQQVGKKLILAIAVLLLVLIFLGYYSHVD